MGDNETVGFIHFVGFIVGCEEGGRCGSQGVRSSGELEREHRQRFASNFVYLIYLITFKKTG